MIYIRLFEIRQRTFMLGFEAAGRACDADHMRIKLEPVIQC